MIEENDEVRASGTRTSASDDSQDNRTLQELHPEAYEMAKRLIEAGVPVFYSRQIGKPGWQKTQPDLAVLDEWRPGGALCAVTGHGLDVLDIDPRNGGDASALDDYMPEHVYGRVVSPSGGEHIYIASLGLTKKGDILPGIDYQAGVDGQGHGFVFLPPTVRKSKADGKRRRYKWKQGLPADLTQRLLLDECVGWDALRQLRGRVPERKVVEYDGPAYGDLTDEQRMSVDEFIERVEARWTAKFAEAVEWPKGYRPSGLGWEALSFLWACEVSDLLVATWSPLGMPEAGELHDRVLPAEIAAAKGCGGKFPYTLKPDLTPPWERDGSVEQDFEVIEGGQCVHVDDDGERCEREVSGGYDDGLCGVHAPRPQCRYVDEDDVRCAKPCEWSHDGWDAACREHKHTDSSDWVDVHAGDDDEDQGELRPGASWKRQDIGAMLDRIESGDIKPIEPDVVGLFYAGRINTLFGASGSAKTWIALVAVRTEILAGRNVVFIDFEDDLLSALQRLIAIGTDKGALRERFHYIQPEEGLSPNKRKALKKTLAMLEPSLVVIDSTGESLALEGKNPNADEDVAGWIRHLPKACAVCGAAVVVIDHIPKAEGTTGPIGSQRKLAAVFAAYRVETVEEFSRASGGSSRVVASKDKAGNHRRGDAVARLEAEAFGDGLVMNLVEVTSGHEEQADQRQAKKEHKIWAAVEEVLSTHGSLSTSKIAELVKFSRNTIGPVLAERVTLGDLTVDPNGPNGAHLYSLVNQPT